MRKPIIAGNWKLNKNIKETVELLEALKKELADIKDVDIAVCPVFTSLVDAAKAIEGSNIKLGAQNVYWEDSGAYTGEIAPAMLKEIGCTYVIIGHSERRTYFGESNETVNKKIKAALVHGLLPIMCIGERLEEREQGKTFAVLEDHLQGGLEGISADDMLKIIIAYEPVWAIGTGKTATPQQAQEAHKYIRDFLKKKYNEDIAAAVRIQYGGSVKPANISELMAQEDLDGALVGGASLKVDSFSQIVKGARK
ncbi:MAG: triose-phosphate isomerase [Candidatus Omnitrophica bacterium]|nr:triose-phosphate isomerase [Candidatus Omnitrophota bacterium]